MNLNTSLLDVKGVGPRTGQTLAAAGLRTVGDMIDFLPRTYEDYENAESIADIKPGKVVIRARAEKISNRYARRNMVITTATLVDNHGDKVVDIPLDFSILGKTQKYSIRDLYAHEELGEFVKLTVFKKAMDNVRPTLEVKPKRVGGATYQVPMEVNSRRATTLAIRWMVNFSRARKEKTMAERLANEILDASNGVGASIKKREDLFKMAEANRAFSHYRF